MLRRFRSLIDLSLASVALALLPAHASGQSLVGNWLVTVEGIRDNESRTLEILSDPASPASATLTAKYGLTSKAKTSVDARLVQSRPPRQLVVVTQALTTITVDELPDGTFAGAFVTKAGNSYPARLVRVTDAQLASIVERPRFSVGDKWRYRFENRKYAKPGCSYELLIERITSKNVYSRINFPNDCDVSITTAYPVAPNTVQKFDLNLNHFHYSPEPYRALDFPLYLGKSWTQKWKWQLNGWTYDDDVSASVDAIETVTTQAGTFEALRIRLVRTYRGSKTGYLTQSGKLEDTFWYSPRIKNFVRRTYVDYGWADITRELTAFSLQ